MIKHKIIFSVLFLLMSLSSLVAAVPLKADVRNVINDLPIANEASSEQMNTSGLSEVLQGIVDFFESFGWMFLIAIAIGIISFLIWFFSKSKIESNRELELRDSDSGDETAIGLYNKTSKGLFSEAVKLNKEGKFHEAIQKTHLASICLLHEKGYIQDELYITNGEITRSIPNQCRMNFQQISRLSELVSFKHSTVSSSDVNECFSSFEELKSA